MQLIKVLKCSRCKEQKPLNAFSFHARAVNRKQRSSACRVCKAARQKLIRHARLNGINIERAERLTAAEKEARKLEMVAYQKKYRKENKKILTAKKHAALDAAKLDGIAHYGGKCSCCGESRIEFLTLEHLDGRSKDIKRRTGKMEWARIKTKNWPPGHTVLCFNCNCSKGIFGKCPHSECKRILAASNSAGDYVI